MRVALLWACRLRGLTEVDAGDDERAAGALVFHLGAVGGFAFDAGAATRGAGVRGRAALGGEACTRGGG